MHRHTMLLLLAVAAIVTLAMTVGTASARRFEVSDQRFRAVWVNNPMVFETQGLGKAICRVTMEGSFHSRTLSKVSGQLIGYVTKAAIDTVNCGTTESVRPATILTETLPWHVAYAGFMGTLPRITKINVTLIGFSYRLEIVGTRCLYTSTVTEPARLEFEVNETTGQVSVLGVEPSAAIRGQAGCLVPTTTLSGGGAVTVLGSETTKITVRLVQ